MQEKQLKKFQREGINEIRMADFNAILADSPGLGKTVQALYTIRENIAKLCPVLVIAPSSLLINWQREAKEWIPGCRTQIIKTTKQPIEKKYHITIMGWDMVHRRIEDLKKKKIKFIIADEAHYVKGGDSTKRGKAFQEICSITSNLLLLTGTPIVNGEQDLEALKAYFNKTPKLIRRLFEEVELSVPPKKRVKLNVELPKELKEEYERVYSQFEEWINSYLSKYMEDGTERDDKAEKAVLNEPLAKINYLRRVLGRAKVPGAAAWIKSMVTKGEPVVVFGMYSDVLDVLSQVLSKLQIPFLRLDGSMNRSQRQIAIDGFNNGQADVFICSMAGREGLTLIRKDRDDLKKPANWLMMERYYTPAAEEQAEDRIRRIGQTRETTMWYLHAKDTIDDKIDDIVEGKRAIVKKTIGSYEIIRSEYHKSLDLWKRLKLNIVDEIPLVEDNPNGGIDLPDIPKSQYVQAVEFDSKIWPIYAVQRYLRNQGCRQKDIIKNNTATRIICRSKAAFQFGTIKVIEYKNGFMFHVGKPARNQAERMRNLRKLKSLGQLEGSDNVPIRIRKAVFRKQKEVTIKPLKALRISGRYRGK